MRSKTALVWAAAIVAATLAAYAPALRGRMVWDDDVFLGGNPFVKPPDSLHRTWLTTERMDYFPLTDTSFWLIARLWGPDPAANHAANVLLHALAAVLLWLALERLKVPGAPVAGLLFALHPVTAESVAWISERKNTLSLVLCAASLLAYLRFDEKAESGKSGELEIRKFGDLEIRKLGHSATAHSPNLPISQSPNLPISRSPTYLLSVVLFLLALLAKTSVVMLPVVLLLCAWWRRGKISRKDLWRSAPFFALSLALGLVTVWFQRERAMAGQALEMPGFIRSLAGAGWAIWFYIGKALAPVGLCAIYPGWDLAKTADLSLWPAALLAGCFALFWIFRRSWGRPLLFGLGCYAAMLLPVLGFMQMYAMKLSLVADRFQYPALIALVALAVGLAARGVELAGPRLKRAAPFAAAALAAVLGLNTWEQAATYRNPGTLWTATLERNPDSWTAYNNLGAYQLNTGEAPPEEALKLLQEAVVLKGDDATAYYNMGRARLMMRQPAEAEAALREAVRLWGPKYAEARMLLAEALRQEGKLPEAAAEYEGLLKASPDFAAAPEAENNLGRLLAGEGKIPEAIANCRAALERMPDSPIILDNLAWVLACAEDARFRDGAEALALAAKADRLSNGSDAKSLDVLAAAYAETGRFEEAAQCARTAAQLAESAGQAEQAKEIRERLALYQSHRPFRLGPANSTE